MRQRRHRLDANHSQVRRDLEAMGFYFEDCSQTSLGYDAIVSKAGRSVKLEIKDGSLAESRRQLTPHEREVHAALLAHGIRIEIITGPQDYQILGREHRGRREG